MTAYDQKHDIWLVSTLGLSGNADVPAVYVNRGRSTSRRRTSTGARRSASTSPSRRPTRRTRTGSRATTGRRARATATATTSTTTTATATASSCSSRRQRSHVDPGAEPRTRTRLPGQREHRDVTRRDDARMSDGQRRLHDRRRAAAHAGDTNIKVASDQRHRHDARRRIVGRCHEHQGRRAVTPFFTTTLAAAANAGDTNIKVANIAAMVAGPDGQHRHRRRRDESRVIAVRRDGGRNRHGRHADLGARLRPCERRPGDPGRSADPHRPGRERRDGDDPGRRHRRSGRDRASR